MEDNLIKEEILNSAKLQQQGISSVLNIELVDSIVRLVYLINKKDVIFTTGIGKSGQIASLLSSLLNSIGIKSSYIHPVEALHGDFSRIINNPNSLIICFSFSGNTKETLNLINMCIDNNIDIVSITKSCKSKLGTVSDIILELGDCCIEADLLHSVPTTSNLSSLFISNLLISSLVFVNNLSEDQYVKYHPGGTLGITLNVPVEKKMREIITIDDTCKLFDVIKNISINKMGISIVVANKDRSKVVGCITDGDIRRFLDTTRIPNRDLLNVGVEKIMTKTPTIVDYTMSCIDAKKLMHDKKITALICVKNNINYCISIHDL